MIVTPSAVTETKTVSTHITASNLQFEIIEVTGILDAHRLEIQENLTFQAPLHIRDRLSLVTNPDITTLTLGDRTFDHYLRGIDVGYGLIPHGEQISQSHLIHLAHEPLGFQGTAQNRVNRLAPNRVVRIDNIDEGGHVTGRLAEVGLDRVFVRPTDLETRQPGRSLIPDVGNEPLITQWLKSVAETEQRKWWKRLDLTQPYETTDLTQYGPFSAVLRLLDGRIACIPSSSNKIVVRDTTGVLSTVEIPASVLGVSTGKRFQGGSVLPSGEVVLTPFSLDTPVIWNPYTNLIQAFDGEGLIGALDGRLTPTPIFGDSLPVVCLSLRRQFGSYRGPTVRVRRTTDNQIADLYFDEDGNVISYQVVNSDDPPVPIVNNALEDWSGPEPPLMVIWYNQRDTGLDAIAEGTVPLIKRGNIPGPFPFAIDFASAKPSTADANFENYLEIQHDSSFSFLDRITLSCVHRPTTWGPQNYTNLVGRGNRHMLRRPSANTMTITIRDEGYTRRDVFDNKITLTNQFAGQNYFYYHVGTYDRTEQGDNGNLWGYSSISYDEMDTAMASGRGELEMSTETSNWLIGRHGGEDNRGERPYHGVMYDVQIYNRAISRQEASRIWLTLSPFSMHN